MRLPRALAALCVTAAASASDQTAELVVRIHEEEGYVEWPIPSSLR